MSFSFSFTAATKALAKAEVAKRMDDVVSQQNVHEMDRDHVVRTAENSIDMLNDEIQEGQHVTVTVSGSLGWSGQPVKITSCNVNVSTYFTPAK